MTDSRSAFDEDRLPWLEAVDEEDAPTGISARRMLAALAVVLLAAAIIAGTFFWLGRQEPAPGGSAELIRAPSEPYKVKPTDPGGLDVAGESETAFETSAGEDHDSRLDLPGQNDQPAVAEAPEPAATPAAEKPAEPAPAPAPSGAKGSVIQLGFFDNRAQAERAWSALSARFPSVAAMSKVILPYQNGIRLRAAAGSPGEARQVCQALIAAGEKCFVAN